MKATSFVFVVLAASLFAGCAEEKAATKPTPDPSKAAAAPASNAAPVAPAKAPEKKDEGGW